MKRIIPYFLILALLLAGCYTAKPIEQDKLNTPTPATTTTPAPKQTEDETYILFTRHGITVDGEEIGSDSTQAVYAANDIIYYEAGHDFTYGEGTAEEEHSAEDAAAHVVVHITQPGTYRLSGTLYAGQIAVDLGEDAEDNPEAVVTLVLDGLDITCTVAPAVIFYNVYECGDKDNPVMDVDTSAAGANVIIADGSTNNVTGSHVARIYKSYTLSEDGTEVVDSKKLHKYDAAFYSKMSMNVDGGGKLNIVADNEGLDSELHLTINGGQIHIISGNDGINTNEDGVSVTTINGGDLTIQVDGGTGEGDGIDSNGWLVINGGTVRAYACSFSGDSGIDADNGVYINGGNVAATGNMLDRLEGSQSYAVFSFAQQQTDFSSSYTLKNEAGETVIEVTPVNGFTNLVVSDFSLVPGTYTLWCGNTQLGGTSAQGGMGGFGGGRPGGGFFDSVPPEDFEGEFTPPEDFEVHIYPVPGEAEGEAPPDDGFNRRPPEHSDGFGGMEPPEGFEDGMEPPEGSFGGGGFGGGRPGGGFGGSFTFEALSGDFVIKEGANFFSFVDILPVG